MRAQNRRTPIRLALIPTSDLRATVKNGIGAVKGSQREYLAEDVRPSFGDSLDLDAALQKHHPQENRWDYLLGHMPSKEVIALEPHSAKQDEIGAIIKKKLAAAEQLRRHLKPSARIARWLWVASGKVHFANTEKARFRLDQSGIQFVGACVTARDLPATKERRRK